MGAVLGAIAAVASYAGSAAGAVGSAAGAAGSAIGGAASAAGSAIGTGISAAGSGLSAVGSGIGSLGSTLGGLGSSAWGGVNTAVQGLGGWQSMLGNALTGAAPSLMRGDYKGAATGAIGGALGGGRGGGLGAILGGGGGGGGQQQGGLGGILGQVLGGGGQQQGGGNQLLDRILSVAGPQTPVKTQPIFDTDRTPAADDKAVVVARTVEDVNRKRAAAGLPPIEPGDVTAGVVDAKPSGPTSKNPQFWEAIDVVLGVIGSEISKSEEREREDERMKYEMAMKAGPGVGSQGSPYGLMMYPQQMLGQLLALSQRAGTPIQAGAPLNF